MTTKVYVLVYRSPDLKPEFVKILGVFQTKEDALARRQELFDLEGINSQVESYILF